MPFRQQVKKLYHSVRRRFHPLTREKILGILKGLDRTGPQILFVHSSLSKCGYIVGGPRTVVEALREWSPGGTLVMPTHTYCYPEASGTRTVFDPGATRSCVGSISDYFWRRPRVTRSLHPTHSLAALGPVQEELCAHHEICPTPCGEGTPYKHLVERDAAVLMFGATMNTYTLFHTAEDAVGVPYLYEPQPIDVYAKGRDNSSYTIRMRRQDMQVPRRFTEMAGWLAQRQALVRRPLGMGELLYIPSCGRVHDLITAELRNDPDFLVAP